MKAGFRETRASFMEHPQAIVSKATVSVTEESVAILGFDYTDYHLTSVRIPGETKVSVVNGKPRETRPGEVATFIEYIDGAGAAHQVALPSKVVDAIVRQRATLHDRNRRSAGKAAMERRIKQGEKPFGKA